MAKEDLLNAAGFKWHPMQTMWVNTKARKAFSCEVVEDRDETWLQSRLSAPVPHGKFWFFFSAPPHPSVCQDILNKCGLSSLAPVLQS